MEWAVWVAEATLRKRLGTPGPPPPREVLPGLYGPRLPVATRPKIGCADRHVGRERAAPWPPPLPRSPRDSRRPPSRRTSRCWATRPGPASLWRPGRWCKPWPTSCGPGSSASCPAWPTRAPGTRTCCSTPRRRGLDHHRPLEASQELREANALAKRHLLGAKGEVEASFAQPSGRPHLSLSLGAARSYRGRGSS